MGGNHSAVGNATKVSEFNFWNDPEAAHIVLNESKCSMYIFPWEPCLLACKATPTEEWRLKVLSSNGNAITKLMDSVDENIRREGNFLACDAYLTCCFLVPKMIKRIEHCHVTVELCGNNTRGMMIVDHKRLEKPNAHVIHEIDPEMFKRFLCWICDHEGHDAEFVQDTNAR